jgi:hypothetical protein
MPAWNPDDITGTARGRRARSPGALVPLALLLAVAGCNAGAPNEAATEAPAAGAAAAAPDPATLVYCEVVATRTTQTDCDYFGKLEQATAQGVAAFNVPRTMVRDEPVTLMMSLSFASEAVVEQYEAAVDAAATDAAATDAAAAAPDTQAPAEPAPDTAPAAPEEPAVAMRPAPLPGPAETVSEGAGETTPFVPIVGRQMRATLAGREFDIKALSPELQEVPLEGETSWQWEVTPRHRGGGAAELVLTTSVVAIAPDGTERVLKRTVRPQRIEVEVDMIDQVEDALKATPTWIGYLAAIGTALGALFAAWKWLLPALRGKSGGD